MYISSNIKCQLTFGDSRGRDRIVAELTSATSAYHH
jgi:hypothetical protein